MNQEFVLELAKIFKLQTIDFCLPDLNVLQPENSTEEDSMKKEEGFDHSQKWSDQLQGKQRFRYLRRNFHARSGSVFQVNPISIESKER